MKQDFSLIPDYDPYLDADDYYYDHEEAERVIRFFKNELTLTKGQWKGKPFIPFDWAEQVIRCLFGWRRRTDNIRRYTTVFIYVPRKNAKSELVAGIANAVFFLDDEPDNEIYIGARDREQATTLYNMSNNMIKQNENLMNEVDSYKSTKEIVAKWDNTKIKAVSRDAMSLHSTSPGLGILDELHTQPDGKLIEAMVSGQGARLQPLMIYITTADTDRDSVCNDELEIARGIRDSKLKNPRYLPVIFETKKEEDWTDHKVWAKANPSYPTTPSRDFLLDQFTRAQGSPAKENSFKRLHLNMITQTTDGWLNLDAWRKGCKDFKESDFYGMDAFLGLDLASKIDMAAFVLFIPEEMTLICRFYCPQVALENDRSGHYQEWKDAGLLRITGEERNNYNLMLEDILEICKLWKIKGIAYDPNNAEMLIQKAEDACPEIEMIEFKQNYSSYSDPCKEFEALINEKNLFHNDLILDWMAGNVICCEYGHSGNIMPDKPKRGSALKIDGIPAAIMAIALWMRLKEEEESVYNKRGLLIL